MVGKGNLTDLGFDKIFRKITAEAERLLLIHKLVVHHENKTSIE